MVMKPALLIRTATPSDVAAIHASMRALARFIGEEHKVRSKPADLTKHMFGDDPAIAGLVAEIAGEYAGMCLYFRSFSTWHGRKGVYVQDLWVEDRFRGAGIGEALLQRCAALTRADGGTYMRLAVDVRNLGAQKFYSRLGLVHYDDDRIHAAYGDAFQALADGDGKANERGTA
jgi:ribosomal protein S18 acetylase RimI-like enzyme